MTDVNRDLSKSLVQPGPDHINYVAPLSEHDRMQLAAGMMAAVAPEIIPAPKVETLSPRAVGLDRMLIDYREMSDADLGRRVREALNEIYRDLRHHQLMEKWVAEVGSVREEIKVQVRYTGWPAVEGVTVAAVEERDADARAELDAVKARRT